VCVWRAKACACQIRYPTTRPEYVRVYVKHGYMWGCTSSTSADGLAARTHANTHAHHTHASRPVYIHIYVYACIYIYTHTHGHQRTHTLSEQTKASQLRTISDRKISYTDYNGSEFIADTVPAPLLTLCTRHMHETYVRGTGKERKKEFSFYGYSTYQTYIW
jgi:hypothetical protein